MAAESPMAGTPVPGPHQPQLVDLESRKSVPAKIWATFVLILMGGIMLLPYAVIDSPPIKDSWWLKFVLTRLIEMVEVFVFCAVVFIWYHPPFVRRVYLKSERKMVWLAFLAKAGFSLTILWVGIWSVLGFVFGGW